MPDVPQVTWWIFGLIALVGLVAASSHRRKDRPSTSDFDGEVTLLNVLLTPMTALLVLGLPGMFVVVVGVLLLILGLGR